MPKRPRETKDVGEKPQPPARRNTERSHSENQERAYIAASRRADRSIEARVQSARNASEIHKKRTGKAFRITEEIVMKEEMYEEEDDDFPRSYRLLNPHMQTDSPELNSRVETYLSNRMAMSQLLSATDTDWRNNEINTTFDQLFPGASRRVRSVPQHHQRWASTPDMMARTPQGPAAANPRGSRTSEQPFSAQFQAINYAAHAHHDRSQSTAGLSAAALSPTDARTDGPLSPAALTPETPRSRGGSTFGLGHPHGGMMGLNSEESVFTSQLPAEARMLMGAVVGGTYGAGMYSDGQQWPTQGFGIEGDAMLGSQSFGYSIDDAKPIKDGEPSSEQYPDPFADMSWGNQGESGAPAKNIADDWETYINDQAWSNEQQ